MATHYNCEFPASYPRQKYMFIYYLDTRDLTR